MTKKGQKWPKDRVWGLFKKIILLLSGICVNESSYGSEHSAKTACLGKIWFSSYSQNDSQPMRFQYSLIVNISLID